MLQSLTVQILADIAQFEANMRRSSSTMARFGDAAAKLGTTLSLSISAPLGLLAKKAIDAYGEMDALTRGLATLERSATTLKARLSELQEVAKLPGLGYKEAIQFDISLRSAGFSADLSKRSMLAFGNALGSIGKGKNELKGVSLQLQQLATKTGGFGADIRVIKEYAPQVGAALQKAFGTTNTEAIAKMGVTGKQVVEKIVAELEKLPKATGGIKNAFENLEDSTFRSMAKLGESLNSALGIEGLVNKLGSAIGSLVDWFTRLSPPTQTVVAAFGAALVVLPPLLAGLGFLASTVLPAVAAGFTLLTGPIGWAVAAVAAAATLIVMHWDKVKKFLLDSNLWDSLGEIFKDGLGFLTSVFGVFANAFQGDWASMWEHAKNVFKYAWNAFIGIAGSGVMAVGGLFAKMLSFMKLDSWAKSVQNRMNEVFLTMRSRQFEINSPKVKGGLFDGLNFGGVNAGKGGDLSSGGGKSKAEKATKYETVLEIMQRRLGEIGEQIKDFNIRGLKVPEDVMKSYYGFSDAIKRAEDALKDLQKTEISAVRPLESNNVIKSKYTKYNKSSEPVAYSMAPVLPNLDKFQDIQKAAKRISKSLIDMNKDISTGLRDAAQSAFEGMGTVIGGLLSGTAGIDELPKMLMGVLGGLLTQLGQMAIAVGLGVQAIQTALKTLNPFVAIAAGIGLIALGTIAKSGVSKMGSARPMANGGLISGPAHILAGEYPGASSDPEVFSPLSKLKGALGDVGGGGGTLTTRISGSDILLILERAGKSKKAYGNGR